MLKAVLFDMDGTLLDSEPLHMQAVKILLRQLGVDVSTYVDEKICGADFEVIWGNNIRKYGINKSLDELIPMQLEVTAKFFENTAINEALGVTHLLTELVEKGVMLAVASSSPRNIVDIILGKLDILKYMNVICAEEDVGETKPSPEIFLLAAKKLNVEPSECIVVEDSPIGITAAKLADMKCIAVNSNNLNHSELERADLIISKFENINYEMLVDLIK